MNYIKKPLTKDSLKNIHRSQLLFNIATQVYDRAVHYLMRSHGKYENKFYYEIDGMTNQQIDNIKYNNDINDINNNDISINDINNRRQYFIRDVIQELKIFFPDSIITSVDKTRFPQGFNGKEEKVTCILIDWS
jgi:hypothetical protein